MPVFNMQEHVSEAIESVLGQSFTNWELVIVDDCSTDSTPEIIRRFEKMDQRIRVTKTRENTNLPGAARNVGISLSSGLYIAFLDHDDVWRPIKLERQLAAFACDDSIDLVHSHLLALHESPIVSLTTLSNPFRRVANRKELEARNMIQCSSVVVRSRTLSAQGGFSEDPSLRAVEDYDLWYRIACRGSIAFLGEIHGWYRITGAGTLANTFLRERLRSFDERNGTHAIRYRRGKLRRVVAGIFAFPISIYVYFIEGEFRIRFGKIPRVWK